MSLNPSGGAQAELALFGGKVSQLPPINLPEGASPDCSDVVFIPGAVNSRPALQRVLATSLPGSPTLTYAKSYVTPSGGIQNLYLDSNGVLWMEDVLATPGTVTQIGAVNPYSYAKSVTAFGREYIAISDKLHGSDIPLQWDGTTLERVTQDGPGSPPLCASVALPSVTLTTSSFFIITGVEGDPAGLSGSTYTSINVFTPTDITGINPGEPLTLSGFTGASSDMNGTWTILQVYPNFPGTSLIIVSASLPDTTVYQTGATGAIPVGSIKRQGNIVTAETSTPHQLQVGYQAQITGLPTTAIGGGIVSITINNENLPGLAVVRTNLAHGLSPGSFVNIANVQVVTIGGGITGLSRTGGIATATTSTAHGLTPGAIVTISGATVGSGTGGFNGTWSVLNVTSSTTFTFAQNTQTDATAGAATLSLAWPIPSTPEPTFFEVVSAPTATTFQVQLNYTDGVWTTGSVQFPWDGTYFVTAVTSPTSFQYQQYGPDAQTGVTANTAVTPYGQAAPGKRSCQVLFLTNQGYITRPSPPVSFVTSGGQYVSVSNIPIGPSNVVARILAFTGALGAYFFYIPIPARINGQIVSTATQINDNTTDSVLLDFSDNTLFASLGINIPGNTPVNQIILDGALGFGFYASRLITWGQRNRIQNMLNMSFDGGALPSSPTLPTGWTPALIGAGGQLSTGHFGQGWLFTNTPPYGISQSFYQDAYGAPIATASTPYRGRAWIQPTGGIGGLVVLIISSASTGFTATCNLLTVTPAPKWIEADFDLPMPSVIPSDMIFTLSGGAGVLVDEISIIYAENPYLDRVMYGSYVDNPEAFDGLTGKFGASQDTRKLMDFGIIRQSMNFLTQDPSGRLHQVSDNGTTEPAGWTVNEIAADCGVLSAFGLVKSQADDNSASGGEEWIAWPSSSGARIFGGDQPWKISQEIQPDWDLISKYYTTSAWGLNDPSSRTLYFGLCLTTGTLGAPNKVYTMSYRELDTAYQIAMSSPIHIGSAGRLSASDHTRKWAPWNLTINGGSLMYRQSAPGPSGLPPQALSVVLLAGNGTAPGSSLTAGNGNVYTLNPAKLTDDDYGMIVPYYITYFFVTQDQEQALSCQDAAGNRVPLGGMRKLLQYVTAFMPGTGQLTLTFYPDALDDPWVLNVQRKLVVSPKSDLECAGGSCVGQRIAIKFATAPLDGTDNGFSLQRVVAVLKRADRLQVRGAAR